MAVPKTVTDLPITPEGLALMNDSDFAKYWDVIMRGERNQGANRFGSQAVRSARSEPLDEDDCHRRSTLQWYADMARCLAMSGKRTHLEAAGDSVYEPCKAEARSNDIYRKRLCKPIG